MNEKEGQSTALLVPSVSRSPAVEIAGLESRTCETFCLTSRQWKCGDHAWTSAMGSQANHHDTYHAFDKI